MKTADSISLEKFLLKLKQQNGWKKIGYYERKTTHPNKIKVIVNSISK